MNGLVIANRGIRTDPDGRVSLNDCHNAAGGLPRHRPSRWLANARTKALVAEMETAGIPAVTSSEGRGGGTFAAPPLAIAYAAWIDPKFHLQVVNTFLEVKQNASSAPAIDLQSALSDPGLLRALLLEHADARIALTQKVEELTPRVSALDRLTAHGQSLSLTAAAKVLQEPPMKFMAWLATIGWTYRINGIGEWQAHQCRIVSGHLRHVMLDINRGGVTLIKAQVKVTPKGVARLAQLLEKPDAPRIAA